MYTKETLEKIDEAYKKYKANVEMRCLIRYFLQQHQLDGFYPLEEFNELLKEHKKEEIDIDTMMWLIEDESDCTLFKCMRWGIEEGLMSIEMINGLLRPMYYIINAD